MADTYTPMQGNTPQGQQQYALNDVLSQIHGMTPSSVPQVSPQQVSQTQSNALNYQSQIPAMMQKSQQQLTQQSGIPQLQGQQSNLAQLFPLYLADQHLSQKYTSSQLSTPNSPIYNSNLQPNQTIYTGNTSAVPNPYLASPQDIINTLSQPSGQGFQGFSSPSLVTSAMEQPISGANNINDLLAQAIGAEQGIVQNKLGDVSQNYQTTENMLQQIANLFANTYQSQSATQSGYPKGSEQDAAYQFNAILNSLGPNATPSDVKAYLNTHESSLKLQGVNTDALSKMQQELVDKGAVTTATGRVKAASTGKVATRNAQGEWKLPNGTVLKEPFNLFGFAPGGGQVIDVASFWNEYKAAGASDQEIIQRLESKGYSLA